MLFKKSAKLFLNRGFKDILIKHAKIMTKKVNIKIRPHFVIVGPGPRYSEKLINYYPTF